MTSEAIEAAVEQVYAAFANQPRPSAIDGCPCCIDGKELGTLHTRPLRQLTEQELWSYGFSALNTVGSPEDYLYFLPRILELTATAAFVDTEITGNKLRRLHPADWPEARREAVRALIDAAIRQALEQGNGWGLDEWVFVAAVSGYALEPWLELTLTHPEALLSFYERNSESVPKGRLGNAFWDRGSPGHDVLLAWFTDPETLRRIDDAYEVRYRAD